MRLAIAMLLGGAAQAVAQEGAVAASDEPATTLGTVLIEGPERPLATAQVELLGQGAYALTDSLGHFRLVSIEPGWDTLQISLLEFESEKVPVFVQPGGLHRVELVVPYPFAQLADLTVQLLGPRAERMQGFGSRAGARPVTAGLSRERRSSEGGPFFSLRCFGQPRGREWPRTGGSSLWGATQFRACEAASPRPAGSWARVGRVEPADPSALLPSSWTA